MVDFWKGSRVYLSVGTLLTLREREGSRFSEAPLQYMTENAFDT